MLTEVFREPQGAMCECLCIRAGYRMVGGMETNRRTAVHLERKLICGVKECRCRDTCEGTVNTQRNKIYRAEWEKADARVQAGGEYA